MMSPEQVIPDEVSINTAQCIKEATHFGYTIYQNICNGHVTTVAWGGVDWLFCGMATVLALCVIGLLLGMMLTMIFDW